MEDCLKERKFVVYGMSSPEAIWTINAFRTNPILKSVQCLDWANPQYTQSQFLSCSHQCYICCMFFKCFNFCGSSKNVSWTYFFVVRVETIGRKIVEPAILTKKNMVWWIYLWRVRSSGI
jgi:hypothetical protein